MGSAAADSVRARSASALAAAGWLALAAPAGATLLVYEPFDYPDATVLEDVAATGRNLTGSWAAPGVTNTFELRAVAPGLGYGALAGVPAASGQKLTQASGTTAGLAVVAVDQDVVVGPGDAIFWSALFTFDDANANRFARITFTDDSNGDTLAFGQATVGAQAIRVEANTAATGQLVAAGADGAFANGQTLLMLGRYLNSAAAGGDRLDLLVYDVADADTLPAVFDPADPGAEHAFTLASLDVDFGAIGSITFAIRGDANNHVDELRIGSTYASVVPEPATVALLGLGLAGLALYPARGGRARRASAGSGSTGRPSQ
jgi:hypothetical protein